MAENNSLFTKPVPNVQVPLPPFSASAGEPAHLINGEEKFPAHFTVQNVKTFTFFSKGGACLKVQIMESPAPRVAFVDVRKVRI